MGEMEFEQRELVKTVNIAVQEMNQSAKEFRLSTPGERFHVSWDESGSATALGQLAFFAEFLEVSGLLLRKPAGLSLSEIATRFGFSHYGSVSVLIAGFERQINEDVHLAELLREVKKIINE
ncbi:hypothetical protein SAMN05421690_10861 [Nitrosomonas sp. Nm51]|uniref:hypothetical protein n=1 Tax=Nitrosomonas sp. Nm51 TaxID=133720 RepID=UPI0008CE04BF|nr:hypothetical protein [Nitrosomonas sp. Nm51]SER81351.1 hypothetical protein SAMN05421690_10861 [Nitrosomonas sp. Nm51]